MRPTLVLFGLFFALCWAQSAADADSAHFGSACPYPEAALAAKHQGTTVFVYVGTKWGNVTHVEVLKSSGDPELDRAAVQCASHWSFDADTMPGKLEVGRHVGAIAWDSAGTRPGADAAGRYEIVPVPHVCGAYYPTAEAKAGIGGTTTLRFTITEEGRVRDVEVDKSSGNENLDDAAKKCAQTWRYRPALKNEKYIAVPWKAEVGWKPGVPE